MGRQIERRMEQITRIESPTPQWDTAVGLIALAIIEWAWRMVA